MSASAQARYYAKKMANPEFREQRREAARQSRARYPEKEEARREVQRALRRGELVRPSACSECGKKGRVEAHHADYSQPLVVEWRCPSCHGKEHRELNAVIPAKTECVNGNSYDKKNSYFDPRGRRRCRICVAASCRRWYARYRKAAL